MSEETQVQVEQEVVEAPGMPAEPETLVDGPGNTAEAEDVINDVLNSGESEDAFSALMGDAKDNVPGTKSPRD